MYTIEIINDKGVAVRMFTLDIEGINSLLINSWPFKVAFKIQKVLNETTITHEIIQNR